MIDIVIAGDYASWTERQFHDATVRDIGPRYGFTRKYHNLYAPGSDSGFPDLVLVNPKMGVVYLELKGAKRSKVSPAQDEWIFDLQCAGQHAYVVYPVDVPILKGILSGKYHKPIRGPEETSVFLDDDIFNLRYYQDQDEEVRAIHHDLGAHPDPRLPASSVRDMILERLG